MHKNTGLGEEVVLSDVFKVEVGERQEYIISCNLFQVL